MGSGAERRMRSCKQHLRGRTVGAMNAHAPTQAGADPPDRFAMRGEAREIGVAQILRSRGQHSERAGGIEKLGIARERIGLLDRIDDHHQFANRAFGAHGVDRARDVFRLREKISDQQNHRTRRGGKRGRQSGVRGAVQTLVGRDRLGEALDDALRRQWPGESEQSCALAAAHAKVGERQGQQSRPVDFRHRGETRCELHRGRTAEPDPDGMRRLPFAFAHKGAFLPRRAAPVYA